MIAWKWLESRNWFAKTFGDKENSVGMERRMTAVVLFCCRCGGALDYLKKMRKRDAELATYLGTNCPQVAMETETGKKCRAFAANAKGILRLIQSIPSPKAEPFKLWLADVGARRLEEIENPELASERMRDLYREKGYSEEWINLRQSGIAIRDSLNGEWKTCA